jgi:hypothetical protein
MEQIELNCPPTSPYDACVKSQITLPSFTKIVKSCYSVADINKDQYTILEEIKDNIRIDTLTGCLTLPTDKTVNNMFQLLINEICLLKTEIAAIKVVNTTQTA